MAIKDGVGILKTTAVLGAAVLAATATMAEEKALDGADSPLEMLTEGTFAADLRYRLEHVEMENFDKNADASTLRTRVNFTTASWYGLTMMGEVDNVTSIGDERYNSTENGQGEYPVVADPEGTDINQAWVKYSGESASGGYGRQRIVHANQRFVGGVAWRQNEQTFDGVRLQWGADAIAFDYSYVYNINRIFGPDDGVQPADWHGENHFLRFNYTPWEGHQFAAYGYLLDIDPQSAYPAGKVENNGSDTWGLEYSGKLGTVGLRAAFARQNDGGQSQLDYSANYYLVEGDIALGPVKALAGYEVLGAGDGVGFKTPLATLHKFQGWADMFLVTPGDGIEDLYLSLSGAVGPVKLAGTWHDFQAEDSSADFGSELDLVATWPINPKLSLQLKYANFSSDNSTLYVDTERAWMTVQFKI